LRLPLIKILRAPAFTARAFLAIALVLAVAASVVPLDIVSAAHSCSMPCCQGMDGADGGACPFNHPGKAKPAAPAQAEQMRGAKAATAETHSDGMNMHDMGHAHASQHAAHNERGEVKVEHPGGQHVSPRNTPQTTNAPKETSESVTSAVISRPCPSDCGAFLNSSTQLRRTRDAAALSYKLQPRPPDMTGLVQDSATIVNTAAALCRQYPPRAPPATL
jgi:hypothetical protein